MRDTILFEFFRFVTQTRLYRRWLWPFRTFIIHMAWGRGSTLCRCVLLLPEHLIPDAILRSLNIQFNWMCYIKGALCCTTAFFCFALLCSSSVLYSNGYHKRLYEQANFWLLYYTSFYKFDRSLIVLRIADVGYIIYYVYRRTLSSIMG